MATAIPFGWQVENANGTPVSGALIDFFVPGTSTRRTPFTDSALTVPTANPVVADAAGWFNVYLSSDLAYDIVVKSADGAITYQTRTVASNISGAQPVDPTLTAIAATAGVSGDILEWTGTDTFRTRKFQVATYAAARLLTGLTVGDRIYINGRTASGDGGEGWFRVIASGTDRDGITLVMADSKALARENMQEGVDLDVAGIVPGTVTVADFDDFVTDMSFQTTRTARARGGIYVFGSKPANMTTPLRIEGQGESITTFERGYSEGGGDFVGFLEWRDATSNNAKLSGMLVRAGSSTTGGTMIRFYATTTSAFSWPDVENVTVSPESGAYAWAIDVDGILNTTSGAQGIRSLNIHRSQFFGGGGAGTNAMRLRNVVNCHLSDVWTNGNVLIGGGGTSSSNSQRVTLTGFEAVGGTLTLENCSGVSVQGTMNHVAVNGTAENVALYGDVNDLTIASGATGAFFGTIRGTLTNNARGTFKVFSRNVNSPEAFGLSGAAIAHTGTTSETTLATVSIPAGAMGPNGFARVTSFWTYTNNANNKIPRVKFGGTTVTGPTLTTTNSYEDIVHVKNANNQAVQIFPSEIQNQVFIPLNAGASAGAVNTANAFDITFTAQLADAADTITLQYYLVEIIYGA